MLRKLGLCYFLVYSSIPCSFSMNSYEEGGFARCQSHYNEMKSFLKIIESNEKALRTDITIVNKAQFTFDEIEKKGISNRKAYEDIKYKCEELQKSVSKFEENVKTLTNQNKEYEKILKSSYELNNSTIQFNSVVNENEMVDMLYKSSLHIPFLVSDGGWFKSSKYGSIECFRADNVKIVANKLVGYVKDLKDEKNKLFSRISTYEKNLGTTNHILEEERKDKKELECKNVELSNELEKIRDELKNTYCTLDVQKASYESLKINFSKLENDFHIEKTGLIDANSQISKNNDDLTKKDKKIDHLEKDVRFFTDKIRLLEEEVATLTKSIDDGRKMVNIGQQNLNTYLKKEEETRNLQIQSYFSELSDLKKKNYLLCQENENLKKISQNFEQKLLVESKKNKELDSSFTVENLEKEIYSLKSKNCELEKSLIKQKSITKGLDSVADFKKIDAKVRDLIPNMITKICERAGVVGDKLDSKINDFMDDDISLLDLLKKFEDFSKEMNF